MTARTQKRLAIVGVLALVALLFAYKAAMVSAAFTSQTACVAVDDSAAATPARRAC
ncbi:hypothetical protein SAMN04490248_14612 [Salinihabitans flavidus]|uniref:Uncharacterized protein n=1 Tax=Salinihabitans flavidus TaxID=569882 RepID=A0A1H8W727_9RHOB|nr:hypothetical protein [Salinihabitans flavidus]SEP23343.1 hypothetical protein SAMN04490248_14612 [Salinihabitans flavidus]